MKAAARLITFLLLAGACAQSGDQVSTVASDAQSPSIADEVPRDESDNALAPNSTPLVGDVVATKRDGIAFATEAAQSLRSETLAVRASIHMGDFLTGADHYGADSFDRTIELDLDRAGSRTELAVRGLGDSDMQVWMDGPRTISQVGSLDPVEYIAGTNATSVADHLPILARMVADSGYEVIAEDETTITFDLVCGADVSALKGGFYEIMCREDGETKVVVDKQTGRLTQIEYSGPMPIYPGVAVQAEGLFSFSDDPSLDPNPPFDTADSAPLACVFETAGIDPNDHEALNQFVSRNRTEANGTLFGGCGFALFPPGADLNS